MASEVQPIPDAYHSVTPYLIIKGAAAAIDFYKAVFDAKELMRMDGPDGRIGHAEIKIGDSAIMLADESPDAGYPSPKTLGGSPVSLMVYVVDVDARYEKAIAAGATVVRAVQDQFYGDRSGCFTDPFGHQWTVATHVEDVPEDEIARRMEAFMQQSH